MNSAALHMKLTSHKPQQKCIHCHTVPTGKYLTFDKTKYGQNCESNDRKSSTKHHMEQVSQCNLQRIPCYMSQMHIIYEKMCTLKFDMNR